MSNETTGWLLDLYPDPQSGCVLWLVGEDGTRRRLIHSFPVTFYAAGPANQLRKLWRWLKAQPIPLELARSERRDLMQGEMLPVLAVETANPIDQTRLFQKVSTAFPDLTYYNADVPLYLYHTAAYETFPLARCRIEIEASEYVAAIEVLDSPWELDPLPAPLRTLSLEPDVEPRHAAPASLVIRWEQHTSRLSLASPRPLLLNLAALLRQYDPDLILTAWGDSWLFPWLLEQSEQCHIPLPLNRDAQHTIEYRRDRSYFTYGQIIYRDQQYHLFGRCHIDAHNAMLYHDYGLDGIFELSRVTGQSLQAAARLSPGSGISAMQIVTALRMGVLVPWHKQQAERPKSARELMYADQGGLVYQPVPGVHRNVAELDFVSMYPSIMVRCNISPETHPNPLPSTLEPPAGADPKGLIPQTLEHLLEKRVSLKRALPTLPKWDPRRKRYKAQASAHKWLLVTCFGYLGYKNARFGRIEAHEAVTAYGREALLRAKEAAEDMGFEILHMYVDGVWVRKDGIDRPEQIQPLLKEISDRTGLAIALEGIYSWVAFLSSRQDQRVPVANRYFGVFQDGSLKTRGIEVRRRDTPRWIAAIQMECLETLASVSNPDQIEKVFPQIASRLRQHVRDLCTGKVPLDNLIVAQKISRAVEAYSNPSPAARAAAQMAAKGKSTRPGQVIRLIMTVRPPGVLAWDIPFPSTPIEVNIDYYCRLLLRALETIFQPFGVDKTSLRRWLFSHGEYNLPSPAPVARPLPWTQTISKGR